LSSLRNKTMFAARPKRASPPKASKPAQSEQRSTILSFLCCCHTELRFLMLPLLTRAVSSPRHTKSVTAADIAPYVSSRRPTQTAVDVASHTIRTN
jgi:hypothetical protein